MQKKLQDATTKATANTTALNGLSTSAKAAAGSLETLTTGHQKTAKAAGDSSTKLKELSGQINALEKSAKQQKSSTDNNKNALEGYAASIAKGASGTQRLQGSVNAANSVLSAQATTVTNNKTAFDGHKLVIDHLKTSFDKIKDVSGEFGPSLQEAADGFQTMKSGLDIVKGGLTGIGEAIKADGFGFLLQILQMIFNAFVQSSTGSAMLKGAISAIGVVVNDVKAVFNSFKQAIIEAFSHPIESLKSLGKMIEQNLINRFKAFGVILDGIIHLDFKKITNGAIQAFTGVTDATDKIGQGITAVKDGVVNTANEMEKAYKNGYEKAGKHVEDHESSVNASIDRQIKKYDELQNKVQTVYAGQNTPAPRGDALEMASHSGTDNTTKNTPQLDKTQLKNEQGAANKTVSIWKKARQKIADEAKKVETKIETDGLKMLSDSIKQQSTAKVAALEKDKASELTNKSLTSAQRLAIEQKFKKQEDQIKAKAFKEEQEASIAQAVINGALAITKVTSQAGALAPLEVGIVIAETAVQVAKIAAQKPPAYAKGGLHYASDGRGGVLPGYSKTDNTNAYLRSGEGIVVSEAMQEPWARNLVSAINVGFGGRDFSITNPGKGYAVGGIFTDGGDANRYYNQPVTDQKNLANTIAYQMINNFPPVYVDVKDVNNQQNILAQTVNRVNL